MFERQQLYCKILYFGMTLTVNLCKQCVLVVTKSADAVSLKKTHWLILYGIDAWNTLAKFVWYVMSLNKPVYVYVFQFLENLLLAVEETSHKFLFSFLSCMQVESKYCLCKDSMFASGT